METAINIPFLKEDFDLGRLGLTIMGDAQKNGEK